METKIVINHVISSIDNASGGPSRSVTHLLTNIAQTDSSIHLQLHTTMSSNPIIKRFTEPNIDLNFYKTNWIGGLKKYKKGIQKLQPDLFHGHGLWQFPVHHMAKTSHRKSIPYIISPRGMLDTWPINHKRFKKKLARILFQDKDLKHAAVLHATSNSEARNIRKLGFRNAIAVIPNGIQILPIREHKKFKRKKKILFLSRLIKNKGIGELLQVWAMLDKVLKSHWELIIVGEGDPNYVEKLNQIKKDLNLKDVSFKGPVYGPEKQDYFEDASLFVLPSYTENFGIAIAEALAYQVPVITTKGTPWEDLETNHCGWWIDIGVLPLKEALEEAIHTNELDLLKMGQNGRQLIEEKYSIESAAKQMLELYDWILQKGDKPDFVFLD